LDIRLAAAKKLTNQNLAQKIYVEIIAQNHKQEDWFKAAVCLRAAENLADQELAQKVYIDIAQDDKHLADRLRAAGKLANQNLAQGIYADIAVNDNDNKWDEEYRKNAIEKLTNPKLLAYVAKNATNSRMRKAAAQKLTDPNLLASVAKH